MKAISPMVATVLLVAFTIGVGALVSIFATGLTTTSTGIASNQSEALSRCAGAWINVYSVQSSTVLYSNPNSQTIANPVLIFSNGTSYTAADTSMVAGETNSQSIGTIGTNTFVIVRGLCQTLVTAEGRCSSIQECWDI